MSWMRKKSICISLLEQLIETIQTDEQDRDKQVCQLYLQDLKQKFQSEQFNQLSDEYKNKDLIHSLYSLLGYSEGVLGNYLERNSPNPPTFMTLQQAKSRLIADYFNSLNEGNDKIASLNIVQWLDENDIILIDEETKKEQ